MKISTVFILVIILGTICFADDVKSRVLVDFEGAFNPVSVQTSDANIMTVSLANNNMLKVNTHHNKDWPGITLKAPDGKWDASAYRYLTVDIINTGKETVRINTRVDNPGADGSKSCVTNGIDIEPYKKQKLIVEIQPRWPLTKELNLIGMRAAPGKGKIDPANITQLIIFVAKPERDHCFLIDNITLEGSIEMLDADTFLPFIDKYGQFIHSDWPGKTKNDRHLRSVAIFEEKDIEKHPAPKSFNKYGGFANGPTLKATGFFRTEKHNNKWWLVDPTGKLFWSHGIDCVHNSTSTPITDRQHYFSDLPEENSPLAKFYGKGSWAPHGYYKDHIPYKTYDLFKANLTRKYGDIWQEKFNNFTHKRHTSQQYISIQNRSLAPKVTGANSPTPSMTALSTTLGKKSQTILPPTTHGASAILCTTS